MATLFYCKFERFESGMRWGGLEKSVTHVEANTGQLFDAGERHTPSIIVAP